MAFHFENQVEPCLKAVCEIGAHPWVPCTACAFNPRGRRHRLHLGITRANCEGAGGNGAKLKNDMAITAADGRPLPFTSLGGGLPILPSRSNNRDGGHKAMAEPAPSVHYDGAKSPFSPLPTITKSQAVEAVQDIAFGSVRPTLPPRLSIRFCPLTERLGRWHRRQDHRISL